MQEYVLVMSLVNSHITDPDLTWGPFTPWLGHGDTFTQPAGDL